MLLGSLDSQLLAECLWHRNHKPSRKQLGLLGLIRIHKWSRVRLWRALTFLMTFQVGVYHQRRPIWTSRALEQQRYHQRCNRYRQSKWLMLQTLSLEWRRLEKNWACTQWLGSHCWWMASIWSGLISVKRSGYSRTDLQRSWLVSTWRSREPSWQRLKRRGFLWRHLLFLLRQRVSARRAG